MSVSQASYSELVDILEAELAVVADGFEGLTAGQWGAPTKLMPVEPDKSPWTLFELAGHLDISIGITTMLIADAVPGQREAERDAVDFFIFPSDDVPTEFYSYAYEVVQERDPSTMSAVLRSTFAETIQQARSSDPGTIGPFPGYEPYPLIRLDDFVSTRIVEAVIHGMDLTDVTGQPSTATLPGIAHTAGLLDSLLTRSSVGGVRPSDLTDDSEWVRAASGRVPHDDPRLPLIV